MLVLDAQSTEHEVVMKPRMRSSILHEVQFVTIVLQHEFFQALFIYLFSNRPVYLPPVSPAVVEQTPSISAIRKKSIEMSI
jgi:hypothetical protein